MALMVSISGIRGIVGETLTPETIVKYTSAYASYCTRGHIIVGRDGRIKAVHTGFPSIGSGEELTRVKKEVKDIVEQMLADKPAK